VTLRNQRHPMPYDARDALVFAERSEWFSSIDELNDAAGDVLARFGVTSFSANLISAPGRMVRPGILFGRQWQEWSRIYNREGHANFDPALRMLHHKTVPFTWNEARERFASAEGERVVRECLEYTGCGEGLVVPVRESDGAVLTAAFSGPQLETQPAARAVMHLVGHYYVTRGRELMFHIAPNPNCPLTPRQIECLRWAHQGKSNLEISLILSISPNTVHNHIEAAKRLLGASKRHIAAFEAWRSGWFE